MAQQLVMGGADVLLGNQDAQPQSQRIRDRFNVWKEKYWTDHGAGRRIKGVMQMVGSVLKGGNFGFVRNYAVITLGFAVTAGVIAATGGGALIVIGVGVGVAAISVGVMAVPVIAPALFKDIRSRFEKTPFDRDVAQKNIQELENFVGVNDVLVLLESGLLGQNFTKADISQLQKMSVKERQIEIIKRLGHARISAQVQERWNDLQNRSLSDRDLAKALGLTVNQVHVLRSNLQKVQILFQPQLDAILQRYEGLIQGDLLNMRDAKAVFGHLRGEEVFQNLLKWRESQGLDKGDQFRLTEKDFESFLDQNYAGAENQAFRSYLQDQWRAHRQNNQVFAQDYVNHMRNQNFDVRRAIETMSFSDLAQLNNTFSFTPSGENYVSGHVTDAVIALYRYGARVAMEGVQERQNTFDFLKERVDVLQHATYDHLVEHSLTSLRSGVDHVLQFEQALHDKRRQLEDVSKEKLEAEEKLLQQQQADVVDQKSVQEQQKKVDDLGKKEQSLKQDVQDHESALYKDSAKGRYHRGAFKERLDVLQLERQLRDAVADQKSRLEGRLNEAKSALKSAMKEITGSVLSRDVLKPLLDLVIEGRNTLTDIRPATEGVQKLLDQKGDRSFLQQWEAEKSPVLLEQLYETFYGTSFTFDQANQSVLALQRMTVIKTWLVAEHFAFQSGQTGALSLDIFQEGAWQNVKTQLVKALPDHAWNLTAIEQRQGGELKLQQDGLENLLKDVDKTLTDQKNDLKTAQDLKESLEKVVQEDPSKALDLDQARNMVRLLEERIGQLQEAKSFVESLIKPSSLTSVMTEFLSDKTPSSSVLRDLQDVFLIKHDAVQALQGYLETRQRQQFFGEMHAFLQHVKENQDAYADIYDGEMLFFHQPGQGSYQDSAAQLHQHFTQFVQDRGVLSDADVQKSKTFFEHLAVFVQHAGFQVSGKFVSRLNSIQAGLEVLANKDTVITAATGIGKSKTIVPLHIIGSLISDPGSLGRLTVNVFADADKAGKALEDQRAKSDFSDGLGERTSPYLDGTFNQVLGENTLKEIIIKGDSLDAQTAELYKTLKTLETDMTSPAVALMIDVSALQSLSLALQSTDTSPLAMQKKYIARQLLQTPRQYLVDEVHTLATVSDLIQKQGADRQLNRSHMKIAKAMQTFDQHLLSAYIYQQAQKEDVSWRFRLQDGKEVQAQAHMEDGALTINLNVLGGQSETITLAKGFEKKALYSLLTEKGTALSAYRSEAHAQLEVGLRSFFMTNGVEKGYLSWTVDGQLNMTEAFVQHPAFRQAISQTGALAARQARLIGLKNSATQDFYRDVPPKGWRKYWKGFQQKVEQFFHRNTGVLFTSELKQGLRTYMTLLTETVGTNYTLLHAGDLDYQGQVMIRAKFVPATEDVTQEKQSFSDPLKLAVLEVYKAQAAREFGLRLNQDQALRTKMLQVYEQLRLSVLHPDWGSVTLREEARRNVEQLKSDGLEDQYLQKRVALEYNTVAHDLTYSPDALRSSAGAVVTLLGQAGANVRGMTATPYQFFFIGFRFKIA